MKNKEKKSERLNIHITPTDKEIIREKATAIGMDMSNYVTAAAIVKDITVVGDRDEFNALVKQVRAVGNNINQLRMLSQFGKISVVNLDEFTQEFISVNEKLDRIIKRTSRWQR